MKKVNTSQIYVVRSKIIFCLNVKKLCNFMKVLIVKWIYRIKTIDVPDLESGYS